MMAFLYYPGKIKLDETIYPGINPHQLMTPHHSDHLSKPCTAFVGQRLLQSGPLVEVALATKTAAENGSSEGILIFDDTTGRVIDVDLRGTKSEIIERLSRPSEAYARGANGARKSAREEATGPKGPGRPKLGVVSREVTLLPRQWDWLATQPGGASAVLRKLVDAAKKGGDGQGKQRASQEAAYHFMLAIAGDLPGYEEATRALFANDRARLEQCIADWTHDIKVHALHLAYGAEAA
jgi:hypothetical protein